MLSAFPVRASGRGFLNAAGHCGKVSWRCSFRRRVWHLGREERKGMAGGFLQTGEVRDHRVISVSEGLSTSVTVVLLSALASCCLGLSHWEEQGRTLV